jgi:hypothetical protein
MGAAAGSIEKLGVGDKAMIGKDASDAGKESTVISADIAKLSTLDPKSPLVQKLIADIGSKAGLVGRELGDIKDELGFIDHDKKDLAHDNGIIDAITHLQKGRMDSKATEHLIKLLQQDNQSKRETGKLRRDDLKSEPEYIRADAADIKINEQILSALGQNLYPPKP